MIRQLLKSFVNYLRRADILLWLLLTAIAVYSLLLLKSVSRATWEDYFRTQVLAVLIGLVGAVFISMIDYMEIANFWYLLAGISIFLMIYTALFGEAVWKRVPGSMWLAGPFKHRNWSRSPLS